MPSLSSWPSAPRWSRPACRPAPGWERPSLASGVAALTLMAGAAVLGARWTFVESAFGGLDRVYVAHKWMGIWALGLASVHMLFKAGMPE